MIGIHKRGSDSTRADYDPAAATHVIALRKYDTAENSIVHEVGHWLDPFAFCQGQGSAAAYGRPELARLFDRIGQTLGSCGDDFEIVRKEIRSFCGKDNG